MKKMRLFCAVLVLSGVTAGQTTISDTVHDAMGRTFNGTLVIEWPSFTTSNGKTVVAGRTSWRIRNGALVIRLEPTVGAVPAGVRYTVTFVSGQASPFSERWNVPVASTPVNLAAVREQALPPGGGELSIRFSDAEIPEGDINGTNRTFRLRTPPIPAESLILTHNGLILRLGVDYTLSERMIEFGTCCVPSAGDIILAWYRRE